MILAPEKPHLSPTQLELFAKCPEAYRRRYILAERIPPGIAALKGTGVHRGAQHNMAQKRETREDLPVDQIVEAAVAAFEAETHGGYSMTPEETKIGRKKLIGTAKDDVVAMARVHAEQQAPDYQPVLVEELVRILLPNSPRDLLGVIDLTDERDRLVDFKTSGKKKTQNDADTSIQLTTYAVAFKAKTGRDPSEVRLDTITRSKNETARDVVRSTRGPADFAALAARINVVNASIDAGLFPPATPGAWWCSAKWCGYHSTCPYVNPQPTIFEITPAPTTEPEPAPRPAPRPKRARAPKQALAPVVVPKTAPRSRARTKAAPVVEKPLLTIKRTKRKASYKEPREILLAQDPHCRWCGTRLTKRTATLDHIVPLAVGGKNDQSNYCLACERCNEWRADSGLDTKHLPPQGKDK